jgi:GMP synthase-like glutamine amidotransferase
MRVVVIRHHLEDDAGFIAAAFAARDAEFVVHLLPEDGPPPALDGVDHIIVLGAKWSVYDEATVGGWIAAELDWLRQADRAGIPVLGICFGAQALTAALGGTVESIGGYEVGWKTLESLEPQTIEPGPWLEFHGDRCLPPAGARLLARNEVGVQAFAIRQHLAVQFHPEVDGAQVKSWLDDDALAMARAAGQDPDELLAQTVAQEAAAAGRAERLVAAALRLAAESG